MPFTHAALSNPALTAFAHLIADMVGADAVGLWICEPTGKTVLRWGAHNISSPTAVLESLQRRLGAKLWEEPLNILAPEAFPAVNDKPVAQLIIFPQRHTQQSHDTLLIAIRHAPALPGSPFRVDLLQALLRHVPHPNQPFDAAKAFEIPPPVTSGRPLRHTLQALEIAEWSYQVDSNELLLSKDAAEMLNASGLGPVSLEFFLQRLPAEPAQALRNAFSACLSNGHAIDVELEVASDANLVRWLRFLGEPSEIKAGIRQTLHGVVHDISAGKLAQQETLRLAMRLTTTLASISEAFATLDRQGRFTYVNQESERLLGHTGSELLDRPIHHMLVGNNPHLLRQEVNCALVEDRRTEIEDYYPALGKWLEVRAYPYAEGLAIYLRDVSERREAQERLKLLRTGIARINDSVIIIQAASNVVEAARIIFVNEAFERLTGLSERNLTGRSLRVLRQRLGAHTFSNLIRAAVSARGSHVLRHELLLPRPNGSPCWVELDVVAVHDDQGVLVHWVAVGRDVTERKLADEKINRLAFFDTLTQLPNRQLLLERLTAALERVKRTPKGGALMFIDLDDFKSLNDTRGHSQGDLLLQQVAQRLTDCLRKGDTVARIGGDEFVVLLQDLGRDPMVAEREAKTVANKLLARLAEPFELGPYLHHSTSSIGVTCFHAGHLGLDELLKQADVAMYHAKGMGGNTLAFFDPAIQSTLNANAVLTTDLRTALETYEQLVLYYQPIFDDARRIIGVEALLRWQHPERGLCYPAEFIPLAENNGLIVPLGLWVLQQACAQLALWARRPETAHLSIAVNVSVGQFRHPDFVAQVVEAITAHHVQPRLLKLELTESLLADRQSIVLNRMEELKRLGVAFSLDDFGTGYSSLSYLKRLPLDQLKIDKGFVADVLTDPSDAAIARAVIDLAHSLGLPVIAEGVETEEQYQFLARCGCDLFQGYLLATPMPLEELEDFLGQPQ